MGGYSRRPLLLPVFASLCVCAAATPLSWAHPAAKDNHDRTIAVKLTPHAVEAVYTLEVDEGRASRDMPFGELAGLATPEEFYAAFARYFAPILANNLVAQLDGKPLDFVCQEHSARLDKENGHLVCAFNLHAAWEPAAGRSHSFSVREGNYHDDNLSRLSLSVQAGDGVRLGEVIAPDKVLQDRPGLERKPGDGERLRKASATFTIADAVSRGEYKPARPPAGGGPRSPPGTGEDASSVRPGAGEGAAEMKPGPKAEGATRPDKLLHLLLDSRRGLVVLLLLAAVFGAAHALTPGHGKTLVAAYLIGERGTVGHAVLLGLVTTVTHTAAVLLLAALLPVFFANTPDSQVQAVLGLVGGLLIAFLGFWLLLRRLAGQADHIHLPGQRHHHHHHDHVAIPANGSKVGFWPLVLLGVQGGIVPCWDAIAMLCVAISAQRLWLAVPLLLAFSAGLAGVLILIGVGVVWTRDWAGGKWGDGPAARRITRALPLASAVLITARACGCATTAPTRAGINPGAPPACRFAPARHPQRPDGCRPPSQPLRPAFRSRPTPRT